jgi:hypothetical protein
MLRLHGNIDADPHCHARSGWYYMDYSIHLVPTQAAAVIVEPAQSFGAATQCTEATALQLIMVGRLDKGTHTS